MAAESRPKRRGQTTKSDMMKKLWNSGPDASNGGKLDPPYICKVCMDEHPRSTFQKSKLCPMKHSMCRTCFQRYIDMCVIDIQKYPIKCHMPKCKKKLHLTHIQKFLTENQLYKFNRFHDKAVHGLEYLDCTKCDGESRVNPKEGQFFGCGKCGIMLCVKCRRSHKADRTCEEVMSDEQRIAERKMKRIAQIHNLVACPGCAFDIERKEGCREMSHECAGRSQPIHFCGFCATVLDPSRVRYELKSGKMHFPEGTMNPCVNITGSQQQREPQSLPVEIRQANKNTSPSIIHEVTETEKAANLALVADFIAKEEVLKKTAAEPTVSELSEKISKLEENAAQKVNEMEN